MSQQQGNLTIDRRTFLKYSGMLGVGVAFGGLMPVSESVAFNRSLQKVTRARLAMGTFAAITVMHPSRTEADDAIGKAFGEMDRVKMNPGTSPDVLDRPAGPTDPDVTILAVRDAKNRKPLALFANYTLHYVGGVPRGRT